MKFLVFNVIVLCSLGYLFTSKPNENFNQWFSNTKDKISNLSKEEVVKTIKKATSSNKLTEDNQIKKTLEKTPETTRKKLFNDFSDLEMTENITAPQPANYDGNPLVQELEISRHSEITQMSKVDIMNNINELQE